MVGSLIVNIMLRVGGIRVSKFYLINGVLEMGGQAAQFIPTVNKPYFKDGGSNSSKIPVYQLQERTIVQIEYGVLCMKCANSAQEKDISFGLASFDTQQRLIA